MRAGKRAHKLGRTQRRRLGPADWYSVLSTKWFIPGRPHPDLWEWIHTQRQLHVSYREEYTKRQILVISCKWEKEESCYEWELHVELQTRTWASLSAASQQIWVPGRWSLGRWCVLSRLYLKIPPGAEAPGASRCCGTHGCSPEFKAERPPQSGLRRKICTTRSETFRYYFSSHWSFILVYRLQGWRKYSDPLLKHSIQKNVCSDCFTIIYYIIRLSFLMH